MMKLPLTYLTLCSLAHAAYVSRMAILSGGMGSPTLSPRVRPTAFRPGVMMRPWMHPRLVQAASHRVPYVFYRNSPHRYAVKHYTATRMTSPWRAATRMPGAGAGTGGTVVSASPTSAEYEFVRASTAARAHAAADVFPTSKPPGVVDEGRWFSECDRTGAIHTIPAPNLSLNEKPIVVLEADSNGNTHSISTEAPKVSYQVTEKFPNLEAKIEQPIGFSKASSLTPPELQSLVRNGAALQLASELGLSAIALPQTALQQPAVVTQQNLIQHHVAPHNFLAHSITPQQFTSHSITPQQITLQNFHSLQNPQNIMQVSPDGIVITPNALYQPDPAFLQKLQNQLLQRFPGVEFVPYPAEMPTQAQVQQNQAQAEQNQVQPQIVQHLVPQPQPQAPLFLLQNEQITKQTPSQFVAAETQNQKNVFLRETQEGAYVTLVPQSLVTNATENHIEITSLTPQNVTIEFVAAESKPEASTIKYVVETTTEGQKSTPVYYPPVTQTATHQAGPNQIAEASQIIHNVVQAVVQASNQNEGTVTPQAQTTVNVQSAQSGGNVVTDSYYSAINDVRAGAALIQVEKPQEPTLSQENVTTTTGIPTSTLNDEMKTYFVQQETKNQNNSNPVTEIKPVLGVPFAKAQNSVNIAYTLHRSDDKDAKVAKDGSVFAGQIVEASVSEDQDFNNHKANLITRRAPIRLVAVADNKNTTSTTTPRVPQKVTVVKARIPPKSKLTFDDKTGEPVLRIYASYVDNAAQKEAIVSRLSNTKREIAIRNKDSWKDTAAKKDSWKDTSMKLAKPHGFEPNPNQVTQFGVKLRSRSDDYVPLFEDYEYHGEY